MARKRTWTDEHTETLRKFVEVEGLTYREISERMPTFSKSYLQTKTIFYNFKSPVKEAVDADIRKMLIEGHSLETIIKTLHVGKDRPKRVFEKLTKEERFLCASNRMTKGTHAGKKTREHIEQINRYWSAHGHPEYKAWYCSESCRIVSNIPMVLPKKLG